MTARGITAFYPTIDTVKLINGKRKVVTESRLPNIFFAYGTEEQLKLFVYEIETDSSDNTVATLSTCVIG